jgi:hypothetical protein
VATPAAVSKYAARHPLEIETPSACRIKQVSQPSVAESIERRLLMRWAARADNPHVAANLVDRLPLLRRRIVLAPACALGALAVLVGCAQALGAFGGTSHAAHAKAGGPSNLGGCTLIESPAGYPDRFITRKFQYKIHPPVPVSGWHGESPLAFRVLFHSIFHGYLVITYRPDLPESQRAGLRSWIRAHANERVVGTSTNEPGSPRLDLVVWGWELRCDDTAPSPAELDRFAARRGT